jgi:tripartite-type tricarboxylate transporter receptor subunit TctC
MIITIRLPEELEAELRRRFDAQGLELASARIARPFSANCFRNSGRDSRALSDVPTMIEAGFPSFAVEAWWGLFVPAGTPATIVDKLHAAVEKVLALQETKDFLFRIANDPLPGPPDLLREMLTRDLAKWGDYVRLAKIEPQ